MRQYYRVKTSLNEMEGSSLNIRKNKDKSKTPTEGINIDNVSNDVTVTTDVPNINDAETNELYLRDTLDEPCTTEEITEEITWTGIVRSQVKQRVRARFTDIIKKELLTTSFLSDLIVNLAQTLLSQNFPLVRGFEDTEFSNKQSKTQFSRMKSNYIQIMSEGYYKTTWLPA